MRIDNSTWGSRDFVEKLTSKRELTEDEAARLLKGRVEEINKAGASMKALYLAIQEKLPYRSQSGATMSSISSARHDIMMAIINNLRA